MKRRAALSLAMAALCQAAVAQATVTIRLEVVPPNPVAGQPFHVVYGIQVQNDQPVDGTPLNLGNLRVLADPGGPRMPRYMMFAGGPGMAMTLSTAVEYIAVAPTVGRYTISGARAMDASSGRVVATHPPVTVNVTAAPAGGVPPSPVAQRPSLGPPGFPIPLMPPGFPDPFGGMAPQGNPPVSSSMDPDAPPPGDLTGADFAPDGFIRVAVDNPHPYVGQQVILRAWLYVPASDAACEPTTEPGLDGFWSEPLIMNQNQCARRWMPQTVGGHGMAAGLVRKIALFPTHAGTMRVGGMAMNAEYIQGDAFFGSRHAVQVHSPDVTVEVREPPTDRRPVGYVPGVVGPVSVQATVDRPSAPVGETVTVTVTATGNGYLGSAGIHGLSAVDGLRIHDGASEVNRTVDGNTVHGVLRNQYLVVATRPGTFPLGDFSVDWLDATTGAYQTAHGVLPTLVATGEALARDEDESRTDPAVELTAFDPAPSLQPHRAVLVTGVAVWGSLALPPVGLCLALAGTALRRRVKARRAADDEAAQNDPEALMAEASRALAANVPVRAVDLASRALARARKVHPAVTTEDARRLVSEAQAACDSARFSGVAGDAAGVLTAVRAAVAALEAAS